MIEASDLYQFDYSRDSIVIKGTTAVKYMLSETGYEVIGKVTNMRKLARTSYWCQHCKYPMDGSVIVNGERDNPYNIVFSNRDEAIRQAFAEVLNQAYDTRDKAILINCINVSRRVFPPSIMSTVLDYVNGDSTTLLKVSRNRHLQSINYNDIWSVTHSYEKRYTNSCPRTNELKRSAKTFQYMVVANFQHICGTASIRGHHKSGDAPMLFHKDDEPYVYAVINLMPRTSGYLRVEGNCHCATYDDDGDFSQNGVLLRKRGTNSFIVFQPGFIMLAAPVSEFCKVHEPVDTLKSLIMFKNPTANVSEFRMCGPCDPRSGQVERDSDFYYDHQDYDEVYAHYKLIKEMTEYLPESTDIKSEPRPSNDFLCSEKMRRPQYGRCSGRPTFITCIQY